MKESCIRHPAGTLVVLLREDYLKLCEGDDCAAMVLSQMEYWHNNKLEHLPQAKAQNQAAVNAGETPTQNTELWIYKTAEDMQSDLLHHFGLRAIGAAFIYLTNRGFLQTRSNPRYAWDKTKQYLFCVEAVQKGVDELSFTVAEQAELEQVRAALQDAPFLKDI